MSNRDRINDLTINLFDGSVKAFEELERLKMLTINIRIAVAKLSDNPEARGLDATADIFANAIDSLEESTKSVRNASKEIARLNKEEI